MPPKSHPQFFSGASHFNVHNGHFTAVGGNMHINKAGAHHYGLRLLLENINRGAFHNASERPEPPRCHPKTRTAIRGQIMEWIKSPDSVHKPIIRLSGPAGAGKTAIEQSIAEQCEEEGLLAASFFFARAASGRNDLSQFIATLAYQLLQSFPEIHDALLTTIEKDSAVFSRSLEVQMQRLVVVPLSSVNTSQPMAVLVDGVDECGSNGKTQAKLLNVIGKAAMSLRHVPIIFFIASRPEYEIRLTFSQEPLRSLTQGLFLDWDHQSNADIHRYLLESFDRIRQNHLALTTTLPLPWPTEKDINTLVQKASGQFIFADTVVKFVDLPRDDPAVRLKIILGMVKAGNLTPFATLDALYQNILFRVHDRRKVLTILTLLLLAKDYSDCLKVITADTLLGFVVRQVLMDMHALVYVPPPNDQNSTLRIHHASLHYFCIDPSRSGEFFIDVRKGHAFLAQCWLEVINKYPHAEAFNATSSLHDCISRFGFHFDKTVTLRPYLFSPSHSRLSIFNLFLILALVTRGYNAWREHAYTFLTCLVFALYHLLVAK